MKQGNVSPLLGNSSQVFLCHHPAMACEEYYKTDPLYYISSQIALITTDTYCDLFYTGLSLHYVKQNVTEKLNQDIVYKSRVITIFHILTPKLMFIGAPKKYQFDLL